MIRLSLTLPAALIATTLSGCAMHTQQMAQAPGGQTPIKRSLESHDLAVLNRLSWGVTPALAQAAERDGMARFITGQLHPGKEDGLPPEIAARIASLRISQAPAASLAQEVVAARRQIVMTADPEQKQMAQRQLQQKMTELGREAQEKSLLLDLYSKNQLLELTTWFWMNHFNVYLPKADIRVFVADYEDTIRAHALGKFRDLLFATMHSPAMLVYLDNAQNADKRINENYAREIMELHTLGVDSGYNQKDVQELARILTGLGVNQTALVPNVRRELRSQYERNGAFEFNPNRHDYGNKLFLGHEIRGSGPGEIDEALDLITNSPAAARFISRKLATFFVADDPPPALVARMADTFARTGGDIAAVLATAFASPEFETSLGAKFKDPQHYAISAVRLAYGEKPIVNVQPIRNWLNRMAEPLYGHETPDGYPITQAAWAGPGAMATRFEIARVIGSSSAGLFKSDAQDAAERPAFPQIAGPLYFAAIGPTLASSTTNVLDKAVSPQDWNTLFLSSPEFMHF
jgi:uncharacterized protein (DUF1800 family)